MITRSTTTLLKISAAVAAAAILIALGTDKVPAGEMSYKPLQASPGALPTPTPDPLEREIGACYESSDCFPSDIYPFHAFTTNRAFCCYLARTINGGTFSWCPAETFDPSSLSCTECAFPCK